MARRWNLDNATGPRGVSRGYECIDVENIDRAMLVSDASRERQKFALKQRRRQEHSTRFMAAGLVDFMPFRTSRRGL